MRAIRLLICGCLLGGLIASSGCGGEEPAEGERTDPTLLGGKADIPSWIKHIPANWGCDSTVTGKFKGFDSAHMYSFPGKIGYTYTFKFSATYPKYKGAVIAVYDAETGVRVAYQRNRWDNEAEVEYAAEADVKYLVAVYSVSWWATGSYSLSAACLITGCKVDSECAQGEYCHFAAGCGQQGAGKCEKIPDACYEIYAPVCGCDGKTYDNDCFAAAAGVSVDHTGQCATQPTKCEQNGGYCTHFLDTCKTGYVSGAPMDCPMGKSGQCCLPAVSLTTDKTAYAEGDSIAASLVNNTADSIFLPGCSVLSWEKLENGTWTNQGPDVVCFWEGFASELKAGATYSATLGTRGVGTWRLTAGYGIGCDSGKPLSQANCKVTTTVTSEAFAVETATACKSTGCSGQICSTKDVITTCEWLPWYACYKKSECGDFGPNGTCGWKQTPAYLACMAQFGQP